MSSWGLVSVGTKGIVFGGDDEQGYLDSFANVRGRI